MKSGRTNIRNKKQSASDSADRQRRARRSPVDAESLDQFIKFGDSLKDLPKTSDKTGRTATDLFPDWKKMGASLSEAVFAAEYLLNGFNATQALLSINEVTNRNWASSIASDMLRRPMVQQLIHEYTTAWLRGKAYELEHKVMETLEALAFYDVSIFLTPDGEPAFSKWEDIPAPLRRCIEGIEVKFFGAQAQRQTVNFSFAKRSDALKSLAAYISILKNGPSAMNETTKVSADAELVLSAVLNSGRKVDRRSPSQLRADNERTLEKAREIQAEKRSGNEVTFQGLG